MLEYHLNPKEVKKTILENKTKRSDACTLKI